MVLYELSLYILSEKIWGEYPGLLQSWYADDFSTSGAGEHIKPTIARIGELGTACVFFLEPEKSQLVQSPGFSEKAARATTAPLEFINGEGERKIGFLCLV